MIGLLVTGSMGLGWLAVIGRNRVPSPPAMTTAFNGLVPPLPGFRIPSLANCRSRTAHITGLARTHHGRASAVRELALALVKLLTWIRYSIAAHQYSTVPQIAKAQPMTLAVSAAGPEWEPRNSSGKA